MLNEVKKKDIKLLKIVANFAKILLKKMKIFIKMNMES